MLQNRFSTQAVNFFPLLRKQARAIMLQQSPFVVSIIIPRIVLFFLVGWRKNKEKILLEEKNVLILWKYSFGGKLQIPEKERIHRRQISNHSCLPAVLITARACSVQERELQWMSLLCPCILQFLVFGSALPSNRQDRILQSQGNYIGPRFFCIQNRGLASIRCTALHMYKGLKKEPRKYY